VNDFLTLGGSGGFVGPAFGVSALVLIGLLVVSLQRLRAKERELARLEAAGLGARRDRGTEAEA